MNIVFDIAHPAHINFFKHAIFYFHQKEGDKVYVTCLRRGKLPVIAKSELEGIDLSFVGKHRGTTFSIIFEANIRKFIELLFFTIKHKVHFGASVGSVPLGAALTLRGKKNIQFDDDPERKKNIFLEKLTATTVYTPPVIEESRKIKNFVALKEWAYLSPAYFKPNKQAYERLNLTAKKYIFAREVSTGSLNYNAQMPGVILSCADRISKDIQVVLSLEDKSLADRYPEHWIILQEPVFDIHSLIYFSSALISSGDSMAREGAQLGIPSIYCGFRDMKANKILVERGMIFENPPEEVPALIDTILNNELKIPDQQAFRKELENDWDDLTKMIISKIESYDKI